MQKGVPEESLGGKILIEFVALIIRNRIYTKIKDALQVMEEQPNFMNVPGNVLKELEKIEMIRQGDGVYRLDHAVTANQKKILKAFNIDAKDVKNGAKDISDRLNPRNITVKI